MNEIAKYIKEREELFVKEFTEIILCEEDCCGAKPVGRIIKDEVDIYLIKEFNSQTIKGLISKIIEENEKLELFNQKGELTEKESNQEAGFYEAKDRINKSLEEII
jgi:hypothetical protein